MVRLLPTNQVPKKKLFVNGHCDSQGPGSWPYLLQQRFNCDLVNFSMGGAGCSYIHDTTISEFSQRSYDLAIISWTPSYWHAIKVDDISKFADSPYTSLYQIALSNCPDLIDPNWIFSIRTKPDPVCSVYKFFENWNQEVRYEQQLEGDLIRILCLQDWFRCTNQPYVFLYSDYPGRPKRSSMQHDELMHLYNQIDLSKWYLDTCLNELSRHNQLSRAQAQGLYANHLESFVRSRGLL